jgi:hypothetical protein
MASALAEAIGFCYTSSMTMMERNAEQFDRMIAELKTNEEIIRRIIDHRRETTDEEMLELCELRVMMVRMESQIRFLYGAGPIPGTGDL